MRALLLLLLLAGVSFTQTPVFTATSDTMRLSDATEISGRWIEYNNPQFEGMATLFVSGDDVSGTTPAVTVYYKLLIGVSVEGDSLFSDKFTLGTVAASYFDNGSFAADTLNGETFIMGDDTEWTNAQSVQFLFEGSGTHETDVLATFKLGK